MSMNEGDSVKVHITRIKVIRDHLVAIGQTTNSARMARLLLGQLPWNFNNFVTLMTAGQRAMPVTFEELVPLVLQSRRLGKRRRMAELMTKPLQFGTRTKARGRVSVAKASPIKTDLTTERIL